MIPASAEHGAGEPLRPELEETVQDHRGLVRRENTQEKMLDVEAGTSLRKDTKRNNHTRTKPDQSHFIKCKTSAHERSTPGIPRPSSG